MAVLVPAEQTQKELLYDFDIHKGLLYCYKQVFDRGEGIYIEVLFTAGNYN